MIEKTLQNPLVLYLAVAALSSLMTVSITYITASSNVRYIAWALDMYCNTPVEKRLVLRDQIAYHSANKNQLIAKCTGDE